RRLAEHELADLLVEPAGTFPVENVRGTDRRRLDELDQHRVRDGRGAVAGDVGDGTIERVLLRLAGIWPVFADAHRLAEGLREDGPIAHREGLEHPRPRRDAGDAGPDRQ